MPNPHQLSAQDNLTSSNNRTFTSTLCGETKFSETQYESNIGSWELNLSDNSLKWSDEIFNIFEVDRSQFGASYEAFLDAVHPEDRQIVNQTYLDSVKLKQPYTIIHRLLMKDGRIKHVQECGKTIYDDHDNACYSIGTVQDITQRLELEEIKQYLLKCGALDTGNDFLPSLACLLSTKLNMEYVSIDWLQGDLSAKPIVTYFDKSYFVKDSYPLAGTAAKYLLEKSFCCFPRDAHSLFPNDKTLQSIKAESFIGTTLCSYDGKIIGFIQGFGKRPLNSSSRAENILNVAALRTVGEIERRLAIEELTSSETKYHSLFDLVPEGIVVIDPHTGAFLDFNNQVCSQLGYDRSELFGMSLYDLDTLKTKEDISFLLEKTITDKYCEFDTKQRTKFGTERHIHMRARYSSLSGSDVILATWFDTTKQKLQENIIRHRLELMEYSNSHSVEEVMIRTLDILEELTDSIISFFIQVDKSVSDMNHSAWSTRTKRDYCKTIENPEKFPLDRAGIWADCAREQRPIILNDYNSCPNKKGLPPGHAVIKRQITVPIIRSGKAIAIIGLGNKPTDYSQNDLDIVLSFVDQVWDIIERKQTLKALQESEEKFSKAFANAPLLIAIKTFEDNRYLEVNEKFTEILGYSSDEVLGKTPVELGFYTQDDDNKLREALIANGTVKDLEMNMIPKSGRPLVCSLWCTSISIGGHKCIISIDHDITHRRKVEQQLIQSQKLESIGRLAGGIAHDFNNMLGVIIGHAELALQKIDQSHSAHTNLSQILDAAYRSSNLTRKLLTLARKQNVEAKILDINDTISGMLNMLRRLIGEDIKLTWNPGYEVHKVKMDPTQLDQILANLSLNGRDAIAGTGNITIRTENVHYTDMEGVEDLDEIKPGKYVMLSICDDGRGMTQDILDHIFEPFFTTKSPGHGTGLGLPTVFGIVKQNNGHIQVVTAGNQGTTFKIYLPAIESPVPQEDKVTSKEISKGNEKILLVEDEVAILEIGSSMLSAYGYQVHAVKSAHEAIDYAQRNGSQIDLLITDIIMPEMNGKELAEKLLNSHPHIKCLFMSGYPANILKERGQFTSAVFCLQKPFNMETLLTKVREVLDTPKDLK